MTQDRIITYGFHDTPLGRLIIGSSNKGLAWLGFVTNTDEAAIVYMKQKIKAKAFKHDPARLSNTLNAINQWVTHGNAMIPMDLHGTDFQKDVWQALLTIPRGQTVSYKDIAKHIGKPKASRAVGSAVGANPITLLIPCHRVLAHDGSIGGYAWGVERKRQILELEKRPKILT